MKYLVAQKLMINETKSNHIAILVPEVAKSFLANIKNEMNKSPYAVVVCGDFNDVPNSYAYYTVGKGLQNTFNKKGAGIGRTFSHISSTLRIDHIFADKRFTVTQFVRNKKKISDHFPIVTDLTLQAPAP